MTTSTARPVKQAAKQVANEAQQPNKWVEWLERFGFVVRGAIYFVMGIMALQLAIGAGGATTNPTGAIALIGAQPQGKLLLALVAIGLTGYSFWGFVRAIWDPLGRGNGMKGLVERVGFLISGVSYGALVIPTVQYLTNKPGGQASGNPTDLAARLFAQPNGKWLVIAFGAFWLIAAIGQFYGAYSAHFAVDFKTGTMSAQEYTWAKRIGRIGFAARGVVFGIVGIFIVQSGLTLDPHKAVNFDGALLKLAQGPNGNLLLALVAVGLVAFGVYSALGARWNKVGGV